jgi:hypothetical protein
MQKQRLHKKKDIENRTRNKSKTRQKTTFAKKKATIAFPIRRIALGYSFYRPNQVGYFPFRCKKNKNKKKTILRNRNNEKLQ